DDLPLARAHLFHVHTQRTDFNAKLARMTYLPGTLRAGHHGLCGRAAVVDAGARHLVALDERHTLARLYEIGRERIARLPRPENQHVILLCHRATRSLMQSLHA